ncbi:hypothetical protein BWX39_01925 [Prevotella intermedia ATCC 25611 = DSM 20706]|uniref:Uncharacterized protein n=1 Tax=Prevotella intermedia TaxID=28131 RepID=A0A2G9IGY8_PREIN|nr:hypothetical protein BWX39_01925 [Prevotella intermedia ATCC 25611 = DSM 20706]PIN29021.1 hypothetical protein CUC04_06270 [Prevotella intermedia]
MALRKRLFWTAKEPLLPCKTYAFTMQNNRFCNTLKARWLRNSFACEKYLHLYRLLFAQKAGSHHQFSTLLTPMF